MEISLEDQILRAVQAQISGAIGDITKFVIALGLLIAIGAGGLSVWFIGTHFGFFLLFAAIAMASTLLVLAAWLVLPGSAAEIFQPLDDAERIGQRTANSWRPLE